MSVKALQERKAYKILRAAYYVSLAVIVFLTMFGLVEAMKEYTMTGIVTIGEWFVELDWPFAYFAKPVSYLTTSLIIFSALHFELHKDAFRKLSPSVRKTFFLLAVIGAFISFYETMYNFSIWNALITRDVMKGIMRIDYLNINYPNPKIPWSLPFATKLFSAFLVISLYFLYFMNRLESELKERGPWKAP